MSPVYPVACRISALYAAVPIFIYNLFSYPVPGDAGHSAPLSPRCRTSCMYALPGRRVSRAHRRHHALIFSLLHSMPARPPYHHMCLPPAALPTLRIHTRRLRLAPTWWWRCCGALGLEADAPRGHLLSIYLPCATVFWQRLIVPPAAPCRAWWRSRGAALRARGARRAARAAAARARRGGARRAAALPRAACRRAPRRAARRRCRWRRAAPACGALYHLQNRAQHARRAAAASASRLAPPFL